MDSFSFTELDPLHQSKAGEELPVVDAKIDGEPAYATRDLAIAHPSKPGLYKLLGRINDQIMLSTGEFVRTLPNLTILTRTEFTLKVNPIPIGSWILFGSLLGL